MVCLLKYGQTAQMTEGESSQISKHVGPMLPVESIQHECIQKTTFYKLPATDFHSQDHLNRGAQC